jgi:hypothetical protein
MRRAGRGRPFMAFVKPLNVIILCAAFGFLGAVVLGLL